MFLKRIRVKRVMNDLCITCVLSQFIIFPKFIKDFLGIKFYGIIIIDTAAKILTNQPSSVSILFRLEHVSTFFDRGMGQELKHR